MRFRKPRTKLVDPTGQLATADAAKAEFWRHEPEEPIDLAAGMAALAKQGCGIFLEIGASTTLVDLGRGCLKDSAGLWAASLRQGEPDWPAMLRTLADLYARGVRIDWEAFDRDFPRRRVVLPTYPFQRQRYWIADDPADAPRSGPGEEASPSTVVRLLGEGKLDSLVEQLKAANSFSDDEVRLLPKVLRALAAQHGGQSPPPQAPHH